MNPQFIIEENKAKKDPSRPLGAYEAAKTINGSVLKANELTN